MNVEELRKFLESYPDDVEIILQKDSEGNGYSPLDGADEAMYVAETAWSGEAYMTDAQIDTHLSGYTDEDRAPEDAVRVIVLWPVD